MMKILITGGAGFVGANLAVSLKERLENCEIRSLDNLYRRGSELNVCRLEQYGVKFFKGDVRNMDDLLNAGGDIDLLIECSAEPSVLAGVSGGLDYLVGTNLNGAINCAELCRRVGAGMIFLSTSRVYPIKILLDCNIRASSKRFDFAEEQKIHGVSYHGISENFPMEGERSLYGATKYAAEIMIREYASTFNFPLVIDRFSVIAGPWQFGKSDQGIAPYWLSGHLFCKELKYIGFGGKGLQVRDFLHIDDAVDLIFKQAKDPANFAVCKCGVFNVGGGVENSASLLELTEICEELTGKKIKIGSDENTRYADVPIYISDYRKLTQFCGWKPQRNLRKIMLDIKLWLETNEDARRIMS